MVAKIDGVSTARPRRGPRRDGAIALANRAAQDCLAQSGRTARDLDFLVNAGVYRDRNVGEPAIATIIQEDIGANPEPPLQGGHGTFSLDVANGGCGVLTAIHVLDGFLSSGAIDLGMVVAADADPHRRREGPPFPYTSLGGALLVSHSGDEKRGFTHFAFDTFPEYAHLFKSYVDWQERPLRRALSRRIPAVKPGRNILHIEQREGYAERCIECAVVAAEGFLDHLHLRPRDVDLLVASTSPPGVLDGLGRALGVPADRFPRIGEGLERAHTAAPLAALEASIRSGQLAQARTTLFVLVGAGITVATALYVQ